MRPFIVLLLVIVAISTLISALLFMGSGDPEPTISPDDGDTPTELVETRPTTPLTQPGPDRNPAPVTPKSNDRKSIASADADSYDNVLFGYVQNENGRAVSGVRVTIAFESAEILIDTMSANRDGDRVTTTNSEGRYEVANLEPSDFYTIYLSHEDYCPAQVNNVRVELSGPTEEPRIILRKGTSLSGAVTGESGEAVEGAELTLDVNMFSHTPGPHRQIAYSDAMGRYEFPHVAAGMLRTLMVSKDGYGTQAHGGISFNGDTPKEKDIELQLAAMVGGRVTDSANGKPIENAEVLALNYSNSNRSSRDFARTDKNGSFTLEHLNSGEYTLLVNARGFNNERQMRVTTGDMNISIKMQRRARVTGQVLSAEDSSRVSSGTLQLRQVHQGSDLTSKMDVTGTFKNGEFVLENVPGGEFLIEANGQSAGYAPTFSDPFTVVEGEDMTGVVIRVTRGGSIRGRVLDDKGAPVANALVSTNENNFVTDEFTRTFGDMFPSNIEPQKVRTGGDGSFEINGIRPDLYQINVTAQGFVKFVQRDIKLSDNEEFSVGDIRMTKGGSVKGTLYDAGGSPLAGGQVFLRMHQQGQYPQSYQAKSDSAGAYIIHNVVPGTYTISATSSALAGGNPFTDIANKKATETKISVRDSVVSSQDLHLTGQPERTVDKSGN